MMIENPVKGKTYDLFGKEPHCGAFYKNLNTLLDQLLEISSDPKMLLYDLQWASKTRQSYKKWMSSHAMIPDLIKGIDGYVYQVKPHLRSLFPLHTGNNKLYTKDFQYKLYFIEFALVNRISKIDFLKADLKLALLPHCLRGDILNCKAKPDKIDYRCVKCSKMCFIREITDVLERNNIRAYIWMNRKLGQTLKAAHKDHETMGVLGIACIPELISGMRKCLKYNLPVVGMPLNANRCARWMGQFYENSVNIAELQKLLQITT